ncbi:MAG: ferrous iron transport protein B [Candidatus Latescibacterota bacterium]|jgi:ferrous iron transport protein B|nr:MAG: ferrous iron transport protein B [Candidatus Latescibacterota bacterium]
MTENLRDTGSRDTRESAGEADLLLVGQPNVGKSVLFSRLTGLRTMASNYPGTTVGFMAGRMRFGGRFYRVVDAPGTYSLEPLDDAARVAIDLIDEAGLIINVVDATHLERHLPLTLELIAQGKPVVVALNMSDEARHLGIEIRTERLSELLGVPVVPTVARTGEGVVRLVAAALSQSIAGKGARSAGDRPAHHPHVPRHPAGDPAEGHEHIAEEKIWSRVGAIVDEVQVLRHHHHTFAQRIEDASVHPVLGGLFALFVLTSSFAVVRLVGEFLVSGGVGIAGEPWFRVPFGMEPLFDAAWRPLMTKLSAWLGGEGFVHHLLIGNLIDGRIDFQQSFGVLTTGLFVPLGVVLPYIFSFYLVLSLLEDTGYLPRLAVFLDNGMHRMGLHGYAIVPTLLGLGCNVPGILATRILENKRQRFIAATLISIAVPCAALQAMIVGLAGARGLWVVALVYGILFVVWVAIGAVLRMTARGFLPELLIEIPPYRAPSPSALASKMWMRVGGFLVEALPIVIAAILVVNVLYSLNVFHYVADATEGVVSSLWGLPKDAIVPLILGILRKEMGAGMFASLALTTKQLISGCVILSMFFPCVATFVVLLKELGWKDTLKATAIMLAAVTATGAAINFLWP